MKLMINNQSELQYSKIISGEKTNKDLKKYMLIIQKTKKNKI